MGSSTLPSPRSVAMMAASSSCSLFGLQNVENPRRERCVLYIVMLNQGHFRAASCQETCWEERPAHARLGGAAARARAPPGRHAQRVPRVADEQRGPLEGTFQDGAVQMTLLAAARRQRVGGCGCIVEAGGQGQ